MKSHAPYRSKSLIAWLMWSAAAAFFFVHYFVRVSPQVILPELMREFEITATALGALGGYFYITYVGFQIPMGLLIDKIGTRIVLSFCIFTACLSTFLFAGASTIEQAYFARCLFGFGAAAAFISSVKLATAWFPSNRLALAVGFTQALGMLGGLVGTAPMPYLLEQFGGWRHTFSGFAYLFLGLGILVALFLRNAPYQIAADIAQPGEKRSASYRGIITNPKTWLNAGFCGLVFAPMLLYGEFWGTSYLQGVQGVSVQQAGVAISAIFIGWCLGSPLSGALADRLGRRPVMQLASLGGLLVLPIIMFVPSLPFPVLLGLNFLFGLVNSGLVASYTIAGEMNSKETAGLALAIANMFTILVGMCLNPLVGKILDWRFSEHPQWAEGLPVYLSSDYNAAFLVMPVCLGLAFLSTFWIPETLKKKG